jgi:hypothetical protein
MFVGVCYVEIPNKAIRANRYEGLKLFLLPLNIECIKLVNNWD